MKKQRILAVVSLLMCLLLPVLALAETSLDGTVVSSESISVTAPFGGTVSSSPLRAGDQINVGDVIATVQTTKVYAPVSGEITGVFGQVGDAVEDVVSRVCAVLYIMPENRYTITADIQKAYNNSLNKYVHIGEIVYIHSYSSSNDNDAVGTITAASGTTYTVETTSGELLMEETVVIYRESDYASTSRIGRGTVSRTSEVAVGSDSSDSSGSTTTASSSSSSENSILYMYVKDGDTVERGQLLYETVTGTLDGLYATSNQIVSEVNGIIASVNVSTGSSISKGDTLITLYPNDKMQVEVEIDEYDLEDIHEGDSVQLEFSYDEADNTQVGTVALISHVSESSDSTDVTYLAYIDFVPDENVRLGMSVIAKVATTETTDSSTAVSDAETPVQETEQAVGE